MNELIPFDFDQQPVRALLDEQGNTWFVGRDVAEALGYSDTINAIKQHCRGVAKHHPIVDALGRAQETRLISEPDLYRLVVGSRLPAAERFERWVFEDVLPTIRKTGGYFAQGPLGRTPGQAAQFITPNPNHAADLLTAADRIFRSVQRTARATGLSTAQAIRRANDQALAYTGINMLAELRIPEPQDPPPLPPPPKAGHDIFVELWACGRLVLLDGQPALPFCPCLGSQAYAAYLAWWARTERTGWPLDQTRFISHLGRLPGWQAGRAASTWETPEPSDQPTYRNRKMVIPSPEALAAAAFDGARIIEQDDKPRGQWLAECHDAFQAALDAASVNGDPA
ncbi:BRO-N domain-containing protein [Castellaniella sp. S9]|uniref:BRO-N domain-containing protein n=1 Tax=Castellaniella sp. S9 TaxID=2993652 RepID=UPI0022B5D48B|nr:Bro-N domain-containing protein [Castellaniella sp. S9]